MLRPLLLLFVVALGLNVAMIFLARPKHAPRNEAPVDQAPAEAAAPAPAPTEPPPADVRPQQTLAQVERIVAERNREARAEVERFRADGWQIVTDVAAPDRRVAALDKKLLKEGREEALRLQLASTTPSPD